MLGFFPALALEGAHGVVEGRVDRFVLARLDALGHGAQGLKGPWSR